MKTTFFKKIKNPLVNVFFIFLAWASSFILSIIAKIIFGDASDSLINYNPFINGFVHGEMSHLAMNLALIFIFLIPEINQKYNFTKIFVITLIIAIVYFPLALAIGLPAVGISGTVYFMLSRACLSKKNTLLYIFFAIMIVPEVINFSNFSDGTAHIVHLIGASLGFISLKPERYRFMPSRVIEYIR
jgi:hypothetical protein